MRVSSLLLTLVLLIVAPLRGQDFIDMGQNISAASEAEIGARLAQLHDNGNGYKVLMVNLDVPMSIGLINQKIATWKSTYDLVLVIGMAEGTDHYAVAGEIADDKQNSQFLQVGAVAFQTAFDNACNQCSTFPPSQRVRVFKLAADAMLQLDVAASAATASGRVNSKVQVRPYLPVRQALQSRIDGFAADLKGYLADWKQARKIHVDAPSATSLWYGEYVTLIDRFGKNVQTAIEDFHQDVSQTNYPGLYLDGTATRVVTHPVHFNAVGRLTGNPIYYRSAIERLRWALSDGEIIPALEEFAAVNNPYAYHELYDLYRWLDKEEWLSFDQGAGATTGATLQQRRDVHLYKFNTLKDDIIPGLSFEVGIGEATLGASMKFETFLVSYSHRYKPWKYKMYLSCLSEQLSASLGAAAPAPDELNFRAGLATTLPQGENINNSAREHPYHFPPIFWRAGLVYTYTGASSGYSTFSGSTTHVLAGKMTFSNSDRTIVVDAAGENYKVNLVNTPGVTILESAAGAGTCIGFGVHDMVGLPASLPRQSAPATYQGQRNTFKRLFLSYSTDQADPTAAQTAQLDEIVADVRAVINEFGTDQEVRIDLYGVAAGLWSGQNIPQQLTDATGLSGADLASYHSYQTSAAQTGKVATYLQGALQSAGVSATDYEIDAERRFKTPSSFNDYVTEKMGKDYALHNDPNAWRAVIVTVSALE